MPLVPWGGLTEDTGIQLINTCNIDTTLQILVGLTVMFPDINEWLELAAYSVDIKSVDGDAKKLKKQFYGVFTSARHARYRKFDAAKTIWINDVMQEDLMGKADPGNMENCEYNAGFQYVAQLIPVRKRHLCQSGDCELMQDNSFAPREGGRKWRLENSTMKDVLFLSPDKTENAFEFAIRYDSKCACGNPRTLQHELSNKDDPLLMYALLPDPTVGFNERDLPREQTFHGTKYTVFAFKIQDKYTMPHFVAEFCVDGKKIVYDGKKNGSYVESKSGGQNVTSVWLVKKRTKNVML